MMANATKFAVTRQGVRDLDHPIQPGSGKVNVGPTERAMSSVGGALLAGLGVSRGGLCGLMLAALGGALIYRGSTGHCSLYAAAGVNTAK
jgi:uncharacterized membrane protein